MPPDIPSSDPTRRRDPTPHLEDDSAALDRFVDAKKAEHDRQAADQAAWDKSAALFTSQLPLAAPAVAALRAKLTTPAPSTLSPEAARALTAQANQTLALYGGNVRPIPKPPPPPSRPPAPLSSEQELNDRIAAERDFQNGMRSGLLTPADRASREAALATLQHAADEQSSDANVRKLALYQDLAALGAPQPCRASDTVESLTAQRTAILHARAEKATDTEDHRIYIGAHGEQGTSGDLARAEASAHWQESLGELDAIQSGPIGGAGSLVGRALGLTDEHRQALAQMGGALDGVMLSMGGQESESDRQVEGLRQVEANLPLRRGPGLSIDQLESLSREYARIAQSNEEWHWDEDIAGGADLTETQKKAVRDFAFHADLLERVPMKEGTRFADFERAGLVQRVDVLPKELWRTSDAEQFAWLDARIPGGRPPGTTWHHSEDPGRMELVPYGAHRMTSHDGGGASGAWSDRGRREP